jgi:hypothetical protein
MRSTALFVSSYPPSVKRSHRNIPWYNDSTASISNRDAEQKVAVAIRAARAMLNESPCAGVMIEKPELTENNEV